jgi:hydrogenase-1 operon protein HyaF
MNPSTMRPFPISVVAMGPGSQGEEAPDYLPMPRMETFSAPRLPDDATPEAVGAAAELLGAFVERMAKCGFAGGAELDLLALSPSVREVINQSLGFGEVSAFTTAPRHWRVQETAFAGLWRVLEVAESGQFVIDRLETGTIPAVLTDAMRSVASADLPAPASYPEGTMNAPALVEEIRLQAAGWQPGDAAHVINLTLLPVSEADLDTLYGWLGHREVSILSRGYGNCRITSTRLQNVWWVQYFNSMDTLILNSIEIVGIPEVALAADEDFVDSIERLREYLDMMAEPV